VYLWIDGRRISGQLLWGKKKKKGKKKEKLNPMNIYRNMATLHLIQDKRQCLLLVY
jgi:hypothetical protein